MLGPAQAVLTGNHENREEPTPPSSGILPSETGPNHWSFNFTMGAFVGSWFTNWLYHPKKVAEKRIRVVLKSVEPGI